MSSFSAHGPSVSERPWISGSAVGMLFESSCTLSANCLAIKSLQTCHEFRSHMLWALMTQTFFSSYSHIICCDTLWNTFQNVDFRG